MNPFILPSAHGDASAADGWTVTSGCQDNSYTAPIGGATAGHLEFRRGISQLRLRTSETIGELFQARFRGPSPSIETEDGHVQIRYRHFSFFDWARAAFIDDPSGSIVLNGTIPWRISIRGGLSELQADLSRLKLAGFQVNGGACDAEVVLPKPSGIVPIVINGGASNLAFLRPEGTSARLRVTGGVSQLRLDEQMFGAIGGHAEIVSPGDRNPTDFYDIQIRGGVSNICVDTL
jgi:hypothetical protein